MYTMAKLQTIYQAYGILTTFYNILRFFKSVAEIAKM